MLEFVWNKIRNKKWLNICLLMGISLLVALFACHPMFEEGANTQVLDNLFLTYAKEQKEFPSIMERTGKCDTKDYPTVQSIYEYIKAYEDKWTSYVQLDTVASQKNLNLSGGSVESNLGRKNDYLNIGLLSEMEKHIDIVQGIGLTDDKTEGEVFPCIISESTMDEYRLVVGEQLYFTFVSTEGKKTVNFEIVGICKEADIKDAYWNKELKDFKDQLFVSEDTFDNLITQYGIDTVNYENSLMLNYNQITPENALKYENYIMQFRYADKSYNDNFFETLDTYHTEQENIRMMLWTLELPCIVLLLLFIYMVTNQIIISEEGEIAVLRSRGITRFQTIRLYLVQSLFLTILGICLGMGIGYGLCKGAASTDAFLTFALKDISAYDFTWKMIPYASIAGVIGIFFMIIPLWKKSKNTIVQQKYKTQSVQNKLFWERCYLDIVLLGISLYLLYNYNRQKESIALSVIKQESIDPIIFLDTSLFIFACALLFFRVSRYLIILINHIGKKKWSSAIYASFLQIIRTWNKQVFIVVFLIMTIGGGIFNANIARTMNANTEERVFYNLGTDMKLMSEWDLKLAAGKSGEIQWEYTEPDYEKYYVMKENGLCNSITRVIEDNNIEISAKNETVEDGLLLAIHTKEFGETAELKEGLNEKHWYYALNALAENTEGVIISKNLADKLGLQVGDSINYTRYHPIEKRSAEKMGTMSAKVCAVVECFPGFNQYEYIKDEKGKIVAKEKYLIVANYATVVNKFQITPYYFWINCDGNNAEKQILEYLNTNHLNYVESHSAAQNIDECKNSAMIQVTNGMFTLNFLISITVCSVGFLIYWIMSIKNREVLFGVYRAMGMGMREINKILVMEQFFHSILAIIAGGGVGALATYLFIRLIAVVYLPEQHNIGIQIFIYQSDMLKLFFIILGVVFVCYIVLRLLLKNIQIAKTLRLGED